MKCESFFIGLNRIISAYFFIIFVIFSSKFYKSQGKVEYYLEKASDKSLAYNKRLSFNRKSLEELSNLPIDSIQLSNYLIVNYNFMDLNSWNDLKSASTILSKKSKILKLNYFIGHSNRILGMYYENLSMNDSAFYFYHKAENIFTEIKSPKELFKIYYDEARVYYYINDYLESEKYLTKAVKIANKNHYIQKQLNAYVFLGMNSNELHEFSDAHKYYLKALKLAQQNSQLPKYNLAICYNHIGFNYLCANNIKKALNYFHKGTKIKETEIYDCETYLQLLDHLGHTELIVKDYRNLPNYFLKTGMIRKSRNIQNGSNFNKLYLSEYYYAIKDTFKSLQYAHEAYNLSQSFRAPKDMLLCLKQLSKVDTKNALKYYQDYIRISDSMQLLERQNRNKFAKIAYETEEITTEKDEAIQQKWIFLGIAVLVFAIGVLVFIIINQRIKQKELQFVQEQQKSDSEIYQLIQTQQHKIDEGREIEKKRIAQDLHDGIMNRLASTRINLHMLNENSDRQTIKKCIPIIQGIQNIEKEIRNISHDLNKDDFKNTDSYLTILESLFKEQKIALKAKCHFEIDRSINWEEIQSNKKIHIYRILQEALNNIRKHAKATTIIASILNRENHLLVEIYDDGIGFSLNGKKKGIGLQNIYSRTKASNGTIEIKSHKDIGTTLILTIPKRKQTNTQQNGNTDKYSYC